MSQSLSRVLVHLIYSTKGREPFIDAEVAPPLYAYQAAVYKACDSPAIIINGTKDHVHALFLLSRRMPLCDLIEEVKKRSSKWIKSQGSRYRAFSWQVGYGAFSIGESQIDTVTRYIARQTEHHRRRSFREEFRLFLDRYRVTYDERYVWD